MAEAPLNAARGIPVPARDFTERLVLDYPGLHLIGGILLVTTALWSVTLMAFTIFAEGISKQLRDGGVPWSSIFSEGFAFR